MLSRRAAPLRAEVTPGNVDTGVYATSES
ncbi:MAG: hypothetical protein JWL99_2789, partial [Streptomyces oryziradicis]|nr:hypothetical protein [Actinacidiphila oryziradicis]